MYKGLATSVSKSNLADPNSQQFKYYPNLTNEKVFVMNKKQGRTVNLGPQPFARIPTSDPSVVTDNSLLFLNNTDSELYYCIYAMNNGTADQFTPEILNTKQPMKIMFTSPDNPAHLHYFPQELYYQVTFEYLTGENVGLSGTLAEIPPLDVGGCEISFLRDRNSSHGFRASVSNKCAQRGVWVFNKKMEELELGINIYSGNSIIASYTLNPLCTSMTHTTISNFYVAVFSQYLLRGRKQLVGGTEVRTGNALMCGGPNDQISLFSIESVLNIPSDDSKSLVISAENEDINFRLGRC